MNPRDANYLEGYRDGYALGYKKGKQCAKTRAKTCKSTAEPHVNTTASGRYVILKNNPALIQAATERLRTAGIDFDVEERDYAMYRSSGWNGTGGANSISREFGFVNNYPHDNRYGVERVDPYCRIEFAPAVIITFGRYKK